jgi:hypothetical protein
VTNADQPVLRVVKGHPTAKELAALVAVLATAGAAARADQERTHPRSSGWAAYWRRGEPLPPAPGAWRASGRPG